MANSSNRLHLTRDQLAAFLKDPKSIKQFERLFASADATQPETIFEVAVSAGNGIAAANQAISRVSAVEQQVAALAAAPAVKQPESRRYGSFYSTVTQTAAAINTAYAVTYNNTDLSFGVYVGTPTSRVYVDRPGIYNFQFSLQLDKAPATAKSVWIWARLNGVDVPNSATEVTLSGSNSAHVAAWNFVFQMSADSYFELMWSTDDTSCQMPALGAVGVVPGIPSVLLSVTDNIGN